MPSEVVLHDQAYLKAVLHAARWPNCAVVGLLIANPLLQEEILDVLPLAHNSLSYLSPMAEAGLAVAKHHVKAQKRDVVGLYCAASRTGEDSVHPARQALAAEIARQLGKDALVLVVRRVSSCPRAYESAGAQMDNAKLASDEVPFLVHSTPRPRTPSNAKTDLQRIFLENPLKIPGIRLPLHPEPPFQDPCPPPKARASRPAVGLGRPPRQLRRLAELQG
jgi:hypothetical protein